MTTLTTIEKKQFWIKWTISNALVIILAYPIGFMIGLFITGAMGYTMSEWGPPYLQSALYIGFGILIGLGIGITQKLLLRKNLKVTSYWIYSIIIGFIIVEIIAGIIFWSTGLNRGEYTFYEGGPLVHTLLISCAGFLVGLLQRPLLNKYYYSTFYWVISCTLAWGISVLITVVNQKNEIALLITFILGALLYGAITGATLMWIMPLKNQK